MIPAIPAEANAEGAAGRLCFFSSDSYGLAHVVRNTRIANRAVTKSDDLTALLISGVGASTFPALAEGCDYLRLPAVVRLSTGEHQCVGMRMDFAELRHIRSILVREAVVAYRPRVLVMDHLSENIQTEVEPVLSLLRTASDRPHRVLAFNDILNHPAVVDSRYRQAGLFDFAATHFDEVWVYGEASFYDWHSEYKMPKDFASKIRYMGFLCDPQLGGNVEERRALVRSRYGFSADQPVVLVTAGGGHDGAYIVQTFLEAIDDPKLQDVGAIVLTGPLMPAHIRSAIGRRVAARGNRLVILDYVSDFEDHLIAADAVLSMGGCTVAEILAAKKPSVLVPRDQWHSSQQVRSRLVGEMGLATVVGLSEASTTRVRVELQEVLSKQPLDHQFEMRGLEAASDRLLALHSDDGPLGRLVES